MMWQAQRGAIIGLVKIQTGIATAVCAIAVLFLALSGNSLAQTAPAFEVVSFKHTGNMLQGGRIEGGRQYTRPMRALRYQGVKLSGEVPLAGIIWYALPWRNEGPQWINEEYFQIEAIAPAGTTREGTKAMVQTVLAERLGLKYHVVDRDTPIYALVRGPGELKLMPSSETEPNPGARQMYAFQKKSATLADFASFLSSLADREVMNKTGIETRFRFDLDWSQEIAPTMREFGQKGDPAIVFTELKKLGLKLEPRKEPIKIMIIDHINKEATPN